MSVRPPQATRLPLTRVNMPVRALPFLVPPNIAASFCTFSSHSRLFNFDAMFNAVVILLFAAVAPYEFDLAVPSPLVCFICSTFGRLANQPARAVFSSP